jgi:uncharacterized membrane protein
MAAKNGGKRYHFLDEVRGFAVLCMVFFHGFYLVGFLFDLEIGRRLYDFFLPAEPYFAGAFIFISGIACCLSRSNLKRGLKLAAVAVAINLLTWFAKYVGLDILIVFGILNLLAFCMLMAAPLLPLVKKIPPVLGLAVAALLFALTAGIEEGYLGFGAARYEIPAAVRDIYPLYPLGIHNSQFASADYFPIFPWSFIFLGGMSTGVWAVRGKFPPFMSNQHIRPLSFVGRHALPIYVLHQPALYGICTAVSWIASFFR